MRLDKRRVQLGLLSILFAFALFIWRTEAEEITVVTRTNVVRPPKLQCELSSQEWHGAPVYKLYNESSQVLQHLTVFSWSEQVLPILSIQKGHGTLRSEAISQPVQPPYDLLPGDTAWFVGPKDGDKNMFSVAWLKNGLSQYENIKLVMVK